MSSTKKRQLFADSVDLTSSTSSSHCTVIATVSDEIAAATPPNSSISHPSFHSMGNNASTEKLKDLSVRNSFIHLIEDDISSPRITATACSIDARAPQKLEALFAEASTSSVSLTTQPSQSTIYEDQTVELPPALTDDSSTIRPTCDHSLTMDNALESSTTQSQSENVKCDEKDVEMDVERDVEKDVVSNLESVDQADESVAAEHLESVDSVQVSPSKTIEVDSAIVTTLTAPHTPIASERAEATDAVMSTSDMFSPLVCNATAKRSVSMSSTKSASANEYTEGRLRSARKVKLMSSLEQEQADVAAVKRSKVEQKVPAKAKKSKAELHLEGVVILCDG